MVKKGLNPYRKSGTAVASPSFTMASSGEDARTGLRLGTSQAFGSNGEINAWDKQDAKRNIAQIAAAVASGQVKRHFEQSNARDRQERTQVLAAAYNDPTGKQWQTLGASIAEKIKQQADREGFLRRVARYNQLNVGEVARVPMPSHDAQAVVATSAAAVEYQLIRTKVFTPPEFAIIGNLRVENIELQQVSSDLLDDVYNMGIEATMVQEDRLWKAAADASVGIDNDAILFAGQMSPNILGSIRQSVANWNLPVSTLLMASDLWNDILSNPNFYDLFDPVTKYDLVMNGTIGTIFGMEIVTDGFRQPNQRVLAAGELYAVASPEFHAAYTDRGGITPTPTDGAQTGTSTKGWFLEEFFSFVLANTRSVARARRV